MLYQVTFSDDLGQFSVKIGIPSTSKMTLGRFDFRVSFVMGSMTGYNTL